MTPRTGSAATAGRRRGAGRGALIAVAALAALLSAAMTMPGASAHDYLVSTNPADGQVVTEALAEVSLTFNEPPLTELGSGIVVEVRAADGTDVAGELSIVDSTLSVPVTFAATGGYTVLWQTVSSDGHPVSGEFNFDYQGPVAGPSDAPSASAEPGPSETPRASATPDASPGSPAPPASPPSAAPVAGEAGTSIPLVLAGVGGAVVIVAAVVVVLAVARRRGTPSSE